MFLFLFFRIAEEKKGALRCELVYLAMQLPVPSQMPFGMLEVTHPRPGRFG
jgi:hypothetical protein